VTDITEQSDRTTIVASEDESLPKMEQGRALLLAYFQGNKTGL
jgi:hypothetical protein